MPPKPKFNRDQIVEAALAIVREGGLDALTARAVGEKLGSSSRPIFTVFENMEELTDAVVDKVRAEFIAYLSESLDYWPSFKEFGLRFMRYADEQPHLYHLLFGCGDGDPANSRILPLREAFAGLLDPLCEEVVKSFGLSGEDAAELIYQMLIFGIGIAHLRLNGVERLTDEAANRAFGGACIGMVLRLKAADGSLDLEQARQMATRTDIVPRKRDEMPAR